MRVQKITAIYAFVLCFVFAPLARAEVVAHTEDPKIAQLTPMQNGLSAVTFVWSITDFSLEQVIALNAGLATIIGTGTDEMSGFDAETFREVNGIHLGISTQPNDILLTLTAPSETFEKGLAHLNALLRKSAFSQDWYRRNLLRLSPVWVTKNRRPAHVTGVLSDYVRFPVLQGSGDPKEEVFRFGMPRQIILRAADGDIKTQVETAVGGLPYRATPAEVRNRGNGPVDLPGGMIFAPDADTSETMIYVVKRQEFSDAANQVNANLLLDYIGAYQGSEMFRIIRQEMRAAYDPSSDFHQIGSDSALMVMSATVPAAEWPEILSTIESIYTKSREGDVSPTGLSNNRRRLLSGYEYKFSSNAGWTAIRYLEQYPDGPERTIRIPVFSALITSTVADIRKAAPTALPAFSDYLVILIGGTLAPSENLRQRGYCELPLNMPMRHCLDELAREQAN